MEVVAFVGPSGTGKSHRALIVAGEHNIDTIIDDGLLIKDNKIIAGYSAKKEPNKIQAVKRAIFMDEQHVQEVRAAISEVQPSHILILGTSVNMINKIISALGLPAIDRVIRIEEVATKNEIAKARESRLKEGKHIIPVPTIELQPHFRGYLIDPLRIFLKKPHHKQHRVREKSIIRPIFSYYGNLSIADAAIASIVDYVAIHNEAIKKTGQIFIKNSSDKEKGITITVEVTIRYGNNIRDVVRAVQTNLKEVVEFMTGMTVKEINVQVKKLSMD